MKGERGFCRNFWSDEELSALRQLAPLGMSELLHHIPGRSKSAINVKASQLGIPIAARYDRLGDAWRGRIPVPPNAHRLVQRLYREMNRQRVLVGEVAERAGVDRSTIAKWATRSNPNLVQIEACLGALGLRLKVGADDDDFDEVKEAA